MTKFIFILFLCLVPVTFIYAHGPDKHKKADESKVMVDSSEAKKEVKISSDHNEAPHEQHLSLSLNNFPSLHPLVVHFPIVLILLTGMFQVASFFVFRYELSILSMLLILGGFVGAYIAATFVHPHTYNLTPIAEAVLVQHERYANYVLWLSGIGGLLKIISHFILKRKLISEILVTILIIGAGICISIAGHHGAVLVHIEGVGPKGQFLKKDQPLKLRP